MGGGVCVQPQCDLRQHVCVIDGQCKCVVCFVLRFTVTNIIVPEFKWTRCWSHVQEHSQWVCCKVIGCTHTFDMPVTPQSLSSPPVLYLPLTHCAEADLRFNRETLKCLLMPNKYAWLQRQPLLWLNWSDRKLIRRLQGQPGRTGEHILRFRWVSVQSVPQRPQSAWAALASNSSFTTNHRGSRIVFLQTSNL